MSSGEILANRAGLILTIPEIVGSEDFFVRSLSGLGACSLAINTSAPLPEANDFACWILPETDFASLDSAGIIASNSSQYTAACINSPFSNSAVPASAKALGFFGSILKALLISSTGLPIKLPS